MKRTKILLLVITTLFFQSLSLAQSPTQIGQNSFDFGGDWDDARDIVVDTNGDYFIAGLKEPWNDSNIKIALATARKSDLTVTWRWVSSEDFSWLSMSGLTRKPNGLISTMISYQSKPARLASVLPDKTVLIDRSFGTESSAMIASTAERTMIVTFGSMTNIYVLDQKDTLTGIYPGRVGYIAVPNLAVTDSLAAISGTDYSSTGNFNSAARIFLLDWQGNLRWSKKVNDCARAAGTIDQNNSVYFGFTELRKVEGQAYPDQILTTVKYDSAGNEIWRKDWDGEPTAGSRLVNWTNKVIPHPGGGCVHLGSIAKNGNQPNANLTDFGAIAYDAEGNVRWKIRLEAGPNWDRNDLWSGVWDDTKHLVFVGSAFKKWDVRPDDHRYIVITKWSIPGITTSIEENRESFLPTAFRLDQNYPNPFNPVTTFSFNLSSKSFVTLNVFDLMGRHVATIISKELSAGSYSKQWNASELSSGVYIYRLDAGVFSRTKKLVLLK